MSATQQHEIARRALAAIAAGLDGHPPLTYQGIAAALGRNPENDARAIAQACDLLDAAAAYAGVPLLALIKVREASGEVNAKAWTRGPYAGHREAILDRSRTHSFVPADIHAIERALVNLSGLGNKKAWKRVIAEGRLDAFLGATVSHGSAVDAGYWWFGDSSERYWLESTDRTDVGANLRAPIADESGAPNWRYTIFRLAKPGDIVLHYHTPSDAIVGFSMVDGEWHDEEITWAARGTFARAKGTTPHRRPGFVIPLRGFTKLPVPLTLERLRSEKEALKALAATAQAKHPRQTLYFPFELKSRPVRPLQGYGFKLPRSFVAMFPELADALAAADPKRTFNGNGSAGSRGGQGRLQSPEERKAIELCAMDAAIAYLSERGYVIQDVSLNESFDILARRGAEVRHVEVKGTTGDATTVFLTANEVAVARKHPDRAMLFVLAGVTLSQGEVIAASGGAPTVLFPWSIDDEALVPKQYEYTLPSR